MIDFSLQRTRWIGGIVAALVLSLGLLAWNSRKCEIVVYNEAAVPRGGVVLLHEDWRWEVEQLPAEGSRHQTVPASLEEGTWRVLLGQAGDAEREVWFAPGPGRRLIVRIRWDGTVDHDVRPAWWETS